MPFISVIMACHNAAPFIGESIKSVLDQSFSDLELIFVDDCSSDGSLNIAQALAEKDNRIKVYSTGQNEGASAARNLAIAKSTGEWLAVLDADDRFIVDKLEKQVSFLMSSDDDVVLVGSGCFKIDECGERLSAYRYPASSPALKKRLRRHQAFPPHSSLIFRASVVRSIGSYRAIFRRAEDFDLLLRLSEHGRFVCLREPLIEYRIHSMNISASNDETGYSQFDYAVMASVCFLLRQRGSVDPSSEEEDILWNRFSIHVASRVKELGYISYSEWKRSWRNSFNLEKRIVGKVWSTSYQLFLHPIYFCLFVAERTVGTRLPLKCLRSWQNEMKL